MGEYRVVARNFSAATENRIHNDEIARKLGFTGALVPGVAVFGHLTYPLVSRFAESWLSCSETSVRFLKPAYHEDPLTITDDEDNSVNYLRCRNEEGTLLAEMQSSMPDSLADPEDATAFDAPARQDERQEINWENVIPDEPFTPWHIQITEDGNRTYTEQIADPLTLYRHVAHPHWLLGIANRALTREYIMPAWIHTGSEIRMRDLVRVGDTLTVRAVPLEKWQRKGHEFIRLYLAYYRDSVLTTEVFHTAIFKVAS